MQDFRRNWLRLKIKDTERETVRNKARNARLSTDISIDRLIKVIQNCVFVSDSLGFAILKQILHILCSLLCKRKNMPLLHHKQEFRHC